MQTVMFLGAAPMQMPPIRYAASRGYRIVTVDYKPENPGHRLADKSYDCSTTDLDGVLDIARNERIDGVVAYASDPAAPTAAYVGNALSLPSNPYKSVQVLTEKDRFRQFLEENGFNVPASESFTDLDSAERFAETLRTAFFVKPVDSSGSKGVTRVERLEDLPDAFEYALGFSRSKRIVVEQEIVRSGYQVAGDGFVTDGRLGFHCWANEHFDFDCNGLVPIGESFPAVLSQESRGAAKQETQRMLDLLGIKTGALNFDFIFTADGTLYFLELGPRNGGNLIPEVIHQCTGVDLIAATVEAALGKPYALPDKVPVDGYWASYMIHATQGGFFDSVEVSDVLRPKIVEKDIWVEPGVEVKTFKGSNDALGSMILKFDNMEEMTSLMDVMSQHVVVRTR